MIEDDIINDEAQGLKIYECSASDDENSMNYDFKCHAIWKAIDNEFDSIKEITNNLPPTSHNKIQFNIVKKAEKRDIEFGNFYGENNDMIKFEFFEILNKFIICNEFLPKNIGIEWYGSDIEVANVNEAIVKCYNMCFGLLKCDKEVVDENESENEFEKEKLKIKEISYNLQFIVWKGRYKTVDELASLETYVVDE